MSAFGVLLKRYRRQCRDPLHERPLTQERLAELLSLEADIVGYSGSTVSNWERGLNQIRRDDRHILVALITVLHQTGGIQTQEQANQFLLAGNYRPLDKEELIQIDANWSYPQNSRLGDPPTPAEQEAALPVSTYSRLFGVETVIEQIIEQLKAPHTRFVVLTGIGGLGKTSVADAIARRAIQQHLFAHVLWITPEVNDPNVTKEPLLQTVIDVLSRQLLPEDNLNTNSANQLTRLRFKLQRYPHLLVIDNVTESTEVGTLLQQLQGMIGSGKCLFTARHHPPMTIEASIVSLPELSLEAATDLLNFQADITGVGTFQQANEQDINALYKIIGGHPLALRLIPGLARLHPLSEIMRGWQTGQTGYIADVYQTVYAAVWQTLLPTEKQLMDIMPLITQTGGTLAYLQAVSGLPRERVWSVLTKLMECCLIEPQGDLYEQRYGIHHLTEQYIRNQWPEDFPPLNAIQAALAYWQRYLAQLAENKWALLDSEQGNLAKVLPLSLELPTEKVTESLREIWQDLFDHLFRYVEQRGYTAVWLPLLEKITEQFRQSSPVWGHLLNRLGILYRLNHQVEAALDLHHRVLKQAQRAEAAAEIAHAYLHLGNDYLLGGQYAAAAEQGILALNQFEQLGMVGSERAAALNLLGTAVHRQGRLEQASRYLHEAITLWRSLNQQPELVRTLRNQAAVMQKMGDNEGAEKCFAEAKKIVRKTASELDRVLIYLAEGTFYFEQERYRQAEVAFNHIDLNYLQKSGQAYYLAYALNNLGNVAFIREHYAEAERLLRDSIQQWQQLAEPLAMANSLGRLGDVVLAQDRQDEAKSIFTEAAALLEPYNHDGRMANLKREIAEALAHLKETKKEG